MAEPAILGQKKREFVCARCGTWNAPFQYLPKTIPLGGTVLGVLIVSCGAPIKVRSERPPTSVEKNTPEFFRWIDSGWDPASVNDDGRCGALITVIALGAASAGDLAQAIADAQAAMRGQGHGR